MFAEEPRGRLVKSPLTLAGDSESRAIDAAPCIMKKLSDEEEARLRREELRQHGPLSQGDGASRCRRRRWPLSRTLSACDRFFVVAACSPPASRRRSL